MRAITFSVSIPGFVLARALGRWTSSVHHGALSGVRLRDLPAPVLPGPDWVRLKVQACGICGTDLGNLTYSASPAMEPFGSFPAVPGHEVLGVVTEVGEGVEGIPPGARVVVDPMLSCATRGYTLPEWCPSCTSGLHSTCERAGEEGPLQVGGRPLARGMMIGYHRDLPGGWGEEMVVHRSQCILVDDALPDRAAVLLEPLAVGLHAVLRGVPAGSPGPVLVIGSGPIALSTVWALRATGFTGEITAQMKRPHEAALATLLGASSVVTPGDAAREAVVATGARAYMPLVGEEVYAGGGYPLIVDCVGNGGSLSQALRFAAPRGRILMLGCSAQIPKLDLTFTWARELEIRGFLGYGMEEWQGERIHTLALAQRLVLESGAPVERMVTHTFPLSDYRSALEAAGNHRVSGAIKVLLEP